jgi:hypothetical protein
MLRAQADGKLGVGATRKEELDLTPSPGTELERGILLLTR